MKIRMPQSSNLPRVAVVRPRLRALIVTEQQLGQPEGDPLLAHADGSGQENRLWKPAGGDRAGQPGHQRLVTVEGMQTHRSEM